MIHEHQRVNKLNSLHNKIVLIFGRWELLPAWIRFFSFRQNHFKLAAILTTATKTKQLQLSTKFEVFRLACITHIRLTTKIYTKRQNLVTKHDRISSFLHLNRFKCPQNPLHFVYLFGKKVTTRRVKNNWVRFCSVDSDTIPQARISRNSDATVPLPRYSAGLTSFWTRGSTCAL